MEETIWLTREHLLAWYKRRDEIQRDEIDKRLKLEKALAAQLRGYLPELEADPVGAMRVASALIDRYFVPEAVDVAMMGERDGKSR